MKILLTGATGYIGKRLLPVLLNNGHHVVCCVRDINRFELLSSFKNQVQVIEIDLLNKDSLKVIPKDIDCAYYLVHSMSSSKNYQDLEKTSAINFRERINQTHVKQVIYLSGMVNDSMLSKHLRSRKKVEDELNKGNYTITTLRAGIIIGSGSASFEIIRDLVEKLPVMVTPKWLNTRCQPIAISDVIKILIQSLNNEKVFNESFDIAGPNVLTYREMLMTYAKVRGLRRFIFTIPVMTPRLSSYWLYFVTSTSYKLAIALVDSMKTEVVARDDRINQIVGVKPLGYIEAIKNAFNQIEQNEIISSWKDSLISGRLDFKISDYINVPNYGCYKDSRKRKYDNKQKCISKLWQIGGSRGWYYANWLWKMRGFLDILFGGVGLRRGRTNPGQIHAGDSLDFWRVLYANKDEGRLLLFAEMKLPGEAWLEFCLKEDYLMQTATFRPKGLWGRLYWIILFPIHGIIFNGMINRLTKS